MNPLDLLIEDGIIDLELTRLKSGKEADVFLVDRGSEVLVAKVYKNKQHRSFKNNAEYKEGRKVRNTRTQRAMKSRSKFGRDAAEEEWKNTEAATLNRLYASGVRVPKPVMFYEGVLLMQLVLGADGCPAPRLIESSYDAAKAKEHYLDLRAQMIRMLCDDLVHGDLSPYNILDAEEGPTIIDFPQIVSAAHTNRASEFFLRDFNNVLDFLAKANTGLQSHRGDGHKIWQAYARKRLTPDFVPTASRPASPNRRRQPKASPNSETAQRRDSSSRPNATRRRGRSKAPPTVETIQRRDTSSQPNSARRNRRPDATQGGTTSGDTASQPNSARSNRRPNAAQGGTTSGDTSSQPNSARSNRRPNAAQSGTTSGGDKPSSASPPKAKRNRRRRRPKGGAGASSQAARTSDPKSSD